MSVKYLISWWITEVPEFGPSYAAYLEPTAWDYWRCADCRQGLMEVQRHVEACEEVWDSVNMTSVLSSNSNTITNEFEHQCVDKVVWVLNPNLTRKLKAATVTLNDYLLLCQHTLTWIVHQGWAMEIVERRGVWDLDMPGVLVGDTMSMDNTFTSVVAARKYKLLTEKIDVGWQQSNVWGNTCEEKANMAQND